MVWTYLLACSTCLSDVEHKPSHQSIRMVWYCLRDVAQITLTRSCKTGDFKVRLSFLRLTNFWNEQASQLSIMMKYMQARPSLKKLQPTDLHLSWPGVREIMVSLSFYGIDILIKSSETIGVHEQNPYIFTCSNSGSRLPLEGHECIFKFAQSCVV